MFAAVASMRALGMRPSPMAWASKRSAYPARLLAGSRQAGYRGAVWPSRTYLNVFGTSIGLYDIARLVAQVACVSLAIRLNRRQDVAPSVTLAVAIVCLPLALWGARVLDILEYWSVSPSFHAAIARRGSSIYGAFLVSLIVLWIALRLLRVPALKFLDAAAPAFALGEAITRLGCFCAGCCYGVPWTGPWAVRFPTGSFALADLKARGLIDPSAAQTMPVHPVQLYGAALMFVVTLVLAARLPRRAHEGEVFYLFLVAYGTQRLLLGTLRVEALMSMEAFSIGFVLAGVGGLAKLHREPAARVPVTFTR